MIYTKGGDKGMTSLGAGGRTAKNSPLVEAYGTIDELNAITGFLYDTLATETLEEMQGVREKLHRVQRELFDIGSEIAALQKITDAHKILTQQECREIGTGDRYLDMQSYRNCETLFSQLDTI